MLPVLMLCALALPARAQLDVGLFSQLYYPRLSYFTYMHPGYQRRPKTTHQQQMEIEAVPLSLNVVNDAPFYPLPLAKQMGRSGRDGDAFLPIDVNQQRADYTKLVHMHKRSAFDEEPEGNDAVLRRHQGAMADPNWVPDIRLRGNWFGD